MVYDRNSRNDGSQASFYGAESMDYGRDYGTGRDYGSSSAREYAAAGQYERGRDGRRDYGPREYGNAGYGRYDRDRGGSGDYRGSYGSDGRRFEDVGRYRDADDDDRARRDLRRSPQGYDHDERGFVARAGDEVRSWFGDEEAERRREADARYDARFGGGRHDDDYRTWRDTQVSALDRDYHEYRTENRAKFESEFATWRTARQGQRDSLGKVAEHMDVVGSDGEHVGTVDKVRDDRILLTKNDADAGGRHHSIPSRWIDSVDTKVTLSKTAADARAAWADEDRGSAMFGYGDNARDRDRTDGGRDAQGRMLNRSFSGTY